MDALLAHPLVRAVSFVGSTPVAKYIYDHGRGARQARAGAGRRQESSGGDARRRHATRPSRPSSARLSAPPASAAWPAACWCRWATPPRRCSICWSKNTQAMQVGDGAASGHRDGSAGDLRSPQARRGLHREGRRRRRQAAVRWPRNRFGRRLLPRPDDLRPRHAGDDHRARGDLRAGALGDPREGRSTRPSSW